MDDLLFPDFFDDPLPPDNPRTALPGTPDKIEVLIARHHAHAALWHSMDTQEDARRARKSRTLRNGQIRFEGVVMEG